MRKADLQGFAVELIEFHHGGFAFAARCIGIAKVEQVLGRGRSRVCRVLDGGGRIQPERRERRGRDLEDRHPATGGLDLRPGRRAEGVGDDEEGRRDLAVAEDLHRLVEGRKVNDNYYLRIKSAWKLESSSLRILKRLCDWREAVARDKNKPRGHIVKDNSIFEIARRAPAVLAQLNGIDDLHPGLIKRYGLDLIDQVVKGSVDVLPPSLSQPLSKGESLVLRSMRDALIVVANEEGIPAGTLFTKKELY